MYKSLTKQDKSMIDAALDNAIGNGNAAAALDHILDDLSRSSDKSSERTARSRQNSVAADHATEQPRLTISFDSCSACGRVMENSIAGLCGRCPKKALAAFINRVRGDSSPLEAASEQLELTGVRTNEVD